jgi:DNA-binding transcriptional ArsR family regulator
MNTVHETNEQSTVPGVCEPEAERETVTSPLTPLDAELYARFFQVLSDPTRVRLLHLLLDAPETGRTVSELVTAVGAPQSRISTHLGCLRWCGLVQTVRSGKQVYYRIADLRVRDLLALGGAMMRDYAAGIASCGVIR